MRKLLAFSLLALLLVGLAACNADKVSKNDYDRLVSELGGIKGALEEMAARSADGVSKSDYDKLVSELGGLKGMLEEKEAATASADETILSGQAASEQAIRGQAAGEQAVVPYEQILIKLGSFLTMQMIDIADDRSLINQNVMPEFMSAQLALYSGLKNAEPGKAVLLNFTDSAIDRMADKAITAANDGARATATARLLIRKRLLAMMPNLLNAHYGTDVIATTSMLQQSESFKKPADPMFNGNSVVVFLYDAVGEDNSEWTGASFVSFRESQEDTIIGTACFIGPGGGEITDAFNDDEKNIWRNIIGLIDDGKSIFTGGGVTCSVYDKRQLQSIIE